MIAYLLIHYGAPSIFLWIINALIELVILAIVFYIVVWVLQAVGIPIPSKVIQLLGVLLALLIILSLFAGCSGVSPVAQATAQAVGKSTLTAVENLAAGAASKAAANATQVVLQDGTKTNLSDLEAAGSEGLFTQVLSVHTATDVGAIFNSFTANKMPAVGAKLTDAFAIADPQTPADKIAVVNAIANGVMTGATK